MMILTACEYEREAHARPEAINVQVGAFVTLMVLMVLMALMVMMAGLLVLL